jgi:D-alanyl-D-alanine carboxypeptidase
MYPARTTKILTALVGIENSDPNEIVMAGREIFLAPRDGKARLCEGEQMPTRDAIYGLMLPFSTAYDLAIIAREAMQLPLFRRVVKKLAYSGFLPDGHRGRNRSEARLPP